MALTKPKIHAGKGTWSSLFLFGISDSIKPFLFLLDAIPFVGVPISVLISIGLSLFEMIGGGFWLLLSGFFGNDTVGTENALWFWALFTVNLVPVIDDVPFTTPAIFYRILQTSKADKIAMKEYEHKLKKEQARLKQDRNTKMQRAAAAAQNAENNRQQAMAISLAQ